MAQRQPPDVIHEPQPQETLLGAIYDTELARRLIGKKLVKRWKEDGIDVPGEVISYDICTSHENLILHLVEWSSPDLIVTHDHISLNELLEHHKHRCRVASATGTVATSISTRPNPNVPPPTNEHLSFQPQNGTTAPTPTDFPVILDLPPAATQKSVLLPTGDEDSPLLQYIATERHLHRDMTITWTLTSTSTPPRTITIDNTSFHNAYNAARRKKTSTGPSTTPALTPILNYHPITDSPGQWTANHPFVNLLIQVRALPTQFLQPPPDKPRSRSTRATDHRCYIEAVSTHGDSTKPSQLWLRSVTDPAIGFLSLDPIATISEGTFRLHTARRAHSRLTTAPVQHTHIPDTSLASESDTNPNQLLKDSILQFGEGLPDRPVDLFGCGLLCSDKPVPWRLQKTYRKAFCVVASLLDDHEEEALKVLMILDGMLRAPFQENEVFTNVLALRLDMFFAGDLSTLAHTSLTDRNPKSPRPNPYPPPDTSTESRQALIAQRILARTGSVGKAAKALRHPSDQPTPSPDRSLFDQFRELCPQPGDEAPLPSIAPIDAPPTTQRFYPHILDPLEGTHLGTTMAFTTAEYKAGSETRDTASQPGLSGLSFSSLRILFQHDDALSQHLTNFCNRVLAGNTKPVSRNLLSAGRAVLLPKATGGVRPIVVGECITRLVSYMALKEAMPQLLPHLLPQQLGCGLPSGTDTVTTTVQATLDLHPDWTAISLDVRNAFNSFDRNTTWEPVQRITPELLPLYAYLYGKPSEQIFADTDGTARSIPSAAGSRQGCVFGTFAYAMSLQPILEAVKEEHLAETEGAILLAYVDDAIIVAPPKQAVAAMRTYSTKLYTHNLSSLRPDKCKAFSPSTFPHTLRQLHGLPAEVPATNSGLTLLGCPITHQSEFALAHAKEAFTPLTKALTLLPYLNSTQMQFNLLQKSLCHLPTFHLRATAFNQSQELRGICLGIDQQIRTVLQRLLPASSPITAEGWSIAKLPLSLGGLGLHSPTDTADVAFASRYISVLPFIGTFFPHLVDGRATPSAVEALRDDHLDPQSHTLAGQISQVLRRLEERHPDVGKIIEDIPSDTPARRVQTMLSQPLHETTLQHLNGALPDRSKAHLLSSAGDTHSWQTIPIRPSLTMSNTQFGIALARRLLQPIYDPSIAHTCPRCGVEMDPFADHTLLCTRNGCNIRTKKWHDPLSRTISSILRANGQRTELEVSDPTTPLHTHKRADIVIRSQSLEVPDTLCDVRTVVCTQQSILSQSSHIPGAAAERGQQLKQRDWELAALFSGCTFAPLVMEDGGRLGPSLRTTLTKTISATTATRQEHNKALNSALRLLTITNLRGVADCIRLSPWPPPTTASDHTLASFYRDPVDTEHPPPLFPSRRQVSIFPKPHCPPPWMRQPGARFFLPPHSTPLSQPPPTHGQGPLATPVVPATRQQSLGLPLAPVVPSPPPRAADPAPLRPENSPQAAGTLPALLPSHMSSISLLASLHQEDAPSDQDLSVT